MLNDLFDPNENLLPHKGEAYFYPAFFDNTESDALFQSLLTQVNWKQEPIRIFGKEVMQPRLTAWFAEEGKSYSYSGITMEAYPWNETLIKIKSKVEKKADVKFNSALLNLYRDGRDSMGWHRDNEKELGVNPVIASVSFGAMRTFQLREYQTKSNLRSIPLGHGSMLLMRGETQPYWEHQVPKTNKINAPRINITFRVVK